MKERKRIPIIAAALSLVAPGLGQLYNAQILKGIIFCLAVLLIPAILLLAGLPGQFLGLAAILIFSFCLWVFVIVEAFIAAKRKDEVVLKVYNKWYIYVLIIVLLNATNLIPSNLAANFVSDVFGFRAFRIPAGSMEPTLLIGDHLIADLKYFKNNELQRTDLVIIQGPKDPSRDFVKRVVALKGEKIEIKNKQVYINDEVLPESYVVHNDANSDDAIRDDFGPELVGPDRCFVLGDNRENSMDSRWWGSIPLSSIKGKPLYIYWAKDKSRIGKKLK
jgi:signal peptidase I